jgi:hypothetical protein
MSISHSSTCLVKEDGTGCDCHNLPKIVKLCKEVGCTLIASIKYCKNHTVKCRHFRVRSKCRECGGGSICKHNKIKSSCKECGGGSLCKHDIQRSYCRECGGGSLCKHDIFRSCCKECGGGSLCDHGKKRSSCIICGGSLFCEHRKIRTRCKDCGRSSYCKHDKRRTNCNECGGGSLCEHNRQKASCKDCKGSQICKHNKIKSVCKDCHGGSICKHNKIKSSCKECNGSIFCSHDKRKSSCRLCGGSRLCKSPWCETYRNKKYEGYCLACFVNNPVNHDKPILRNYKTKEKEVADRVQEAFPNFTWVADKRVEDGCSRRRPDLLLDLGTHLIIVEVDEDKHDSYECSCENKRLMELSQDLQHRPIVFIRFNPDGYKNQEGQLVRSCWKLNTLGVMAIMKTKQKEWTERITCLIAQIQYWCDHPTEKTIEIIQLYYDAD